MKARQFPQIILPGEETPINENFLQKLESLEKRGWKLCAGCMRCESLCPFCSINTRKKMGLPPEGREVTEIC